MKETIVRIGSRRLFGILSAPDVFESAVPPVVIPNTGLEHRIGPNRLHVHLCRALAESGIPALRLDLSGMGDSALGDQVDATADLKAGIDYLQQVGYGNKVIVVGLCSGAHDVHQLARADSRVVAAAFIDGYTYPTPLFRLNYVLQRLAEPSRWISVLRRKLSRNSMTDKEGFEADKIQYYPQPDRAQMNEDVELFLRRRVALWYIYTGQVQNEYNYTAQLYDAFPQLRNRSSVKLSYLIHADHTFSRMEMRSHMATALVRWVRHGLKGGFPAFGETSTAD
jgi:dienelactone hydrolase